MANNRIYLRCKTCGECLFMGKSRFEIAYEIDYGDLDDGEN